MTGFLKNHPAITITVLYVYVSIVGLIYQYFHLESFGVNILHFSNTSDFFMSFGKATPFLFTLLIIHSLILIKDMLFYQRHIDNPKFITRCKILIVQTRHVEFWLVVAVLPVLAAFGGKIYGNNISAHSSILIDEKSAKLLNIPSKATFFDSTENYIFLADQNKRYVVKRDKLNSFEIINNHQQAWY